MKKQAEIRICDYCKERVQQEELQFGGSPFNGWYSLERTCGSTALSALEKFNGPWDFCSLECLETFLQESNENRKGV